jgi:hypothetical protein
MISLMVFPLQQILVHLHKCHNTKTHALMSAKRNVQKTVVSRVAPPTPVKIATQLRKSVVRNELL